MSTFDGNLVVRGDLDVLEHINVRKTIALPSDSVTADNIATGANVPASKTVNRQSLVHRQGGTVVDAAAVVGIAENSGTIAGVKVRPDGVPTGGDLQYTIDVQRAASGSGSYTTLLDSVVVIDSSSVAHTVLDAVLASSPDVSQDDSIRVLVTTSGSTGTQGAGITVRVLFDENGA